MNREELDQRLPSTDATSLHSRTERLRRALLGFGSFFAAARHDDPLPYLRDLASDLLYAEDLHIAVPAPVHNHGVQQPDRLYSPIVIGRRAVGAIEASRCKPFDDDERILADTLGQIIGAVLDQSSLQSQYHQYRTQVQANSETLDLLLDFSREMARGVPDQLELGLQLATQVPQMVGGDRASLLLLPFDRPDEPVLLLSTGVISRAERARAVRQEGLAGMVLRDLRPMIIDETDTDRRWFSLGAHDYEQPTRCAMAVPLLWGERVLGALTVTTTESHLFDTPQLHLLELIACHVSLALHCASLDAQLRQLQTVLGEATAILGEALQYAHRHLHHGDGADNAAGRPAVPEAYDANSLAAALELIAGVQARLQQANRALLAFNEGGTMV